MKPLTRFLCAVAVAISGLALRRRVLAPDLGGTKVIFLGPGCGHVSYTMGFVDTMIRDEVIQGAIVKSGAVFGGISSGALTAAFAMASLNGVGTMEHWHQNEIRKGVEAVQRQSALVIGEELVRAGRRFYGQCLNATLEERRHEHDAANKTCLDMECGADDNALIPWLQKFPVPLTEVSTVKPLFATRFTSAEAFVAVMQASSYIPGLMGLKPWLTIQESFLDGSANGNGDSFRRVSDGYMGSLFAAWPSNYMFVGFLPPFTYSYLLLGGAAYLRAFRHDSTVGGVVGFFVKLWPWGDPEWADSSFKRGQQDANRARHQLRTEMCEFLGSC